MSPYPWSTDDDEIAWDAIIVGIGDDSPAWIAVGMTLAEPLANIYLPPFARHKLRGGFQPKMREISEMGNTATPLERAFELAKSGQFANVSDIRRQLDKERLDTAQITGRMLLSQLNELIKSALEAKRDG